MKSDLPQRTFEFARRAVSLSRSLDRGAGVTRVLSNQLLRSATSVGANVEEAQASHSRRDFAARYTIACREAREAHYWLRLLAAAELVPPDHLAPLTAEASELVAILTTIVRKVRESSKGEV